MYFICSFCGISSCVCSGYGKQYGEDGQITYEGKFLCGKPEEEFKRSPEYSAYLKKEEERKAKKAAETLKAKKKAKDEKNSKIGCIIIIIIVIILALTLPLVRTPKFNGSIFSIKCFLRSVI